MYAMPRNQFNRLRKRISRMQIGSRDVSQKYIPKGACQKINDVTHVLKYEIKERNKSLYR